MGYHPRIESADHASFVTIRTLQSRLWFVNNPELEESILGYLGRYSERYNVGVYAFGIEGNHYHGALSFPDLNRAGFMRDLNACSARAVAKYTEEFEGGKVWARRYSAEFLPSAEDIEEYFFYIVLQPVKDGLVENISEYPGYNCFKDAADGITRQYRYIRWAEYNAKKRHNPNISKLDYIETATLKFTRLPGYEDYTQEEYSKILHQKLEERRLKIVEERRSKGLGFVGTKALKKTERGALPKNTKTATSTTHRPRILSVCPQRRAEHKAWYFHVYFTYKEASQEYRSGKLHVPFPSGTYRPYCRYQEFQQTVTQGFT